MKKKKTKKDCNCYANIERVGRAYFRCARCGRDLSLEVASMSNEAYAQLPKRKVTKD